MEIYLDVLIILNTYLTWLLINLTAAVSKTRLKPVNCAVSSLIGGLSSLIILLPDAVKPMPFTYMILRILTCPAITISAFFGNRPKKLAVLTLIFLSMSMLTSGALTLLETFVHIPKILLPGGFIYLDISPLVLTLTTAAIYIIIIIADRFFGRHLGSANSYRVEFKIGCKAYSLDGIADTGNKARDLFTGLPVIICTGIELPEDEKYLPVPYTTINGEGLLYALRPKELKIISSAGEPLKADALIAASPQKSGEARAVFNPSIIESV